MSAPNSSLTRRLLTLAMALALSSCQDNTPPAASLPPPAEPTPAPAPADNGMKPATGTVEATDENIAAAEKSIEEAAEAARKQWVDKTFEEFEATVYKEPGENGKYIVNGDIPIADRKQLQAFFEKLQRDSSETAHGKLTALTVNTVNGGVDVWTSEKKKQLSYCISNEFGTHKPAVLADMQAATHAWEEAADVDFSHVSAQDGNCTDSNPNVLFDVRPVDVDAQYYARAFFPSDVRRDRNVLIDNSSFSLNPSEKLKLVGILRHELGHTLGWRHEHVRPEAGACFEGTQFQPLTTYDRFSVMHYPQCNGGGDWSLTLTGLDKLGAACIYGKGSNNSEDLNQCALHGPDAPTTGARETKVFDNQSVAKDAKKQYGPFSVKPGSIATVKMSGVGTTPGDPDLYVRYLGQPDSTRWNCRPYLSHANETCELEVPANRNKIYVMARGYAAGSYKLEVTYTKPD